MAPVRNHKVSWAQRLDLRPAQGYDSISKGRTKPGGKGMNPKVFFKVL